MELATSKPLEPRRRGYWTY